MGCGKKAEEAEPVKEGERGRESTLSQCTPEVMGGASKKRMSIQKDPVRKGRRIGAGSLLSIFKADVRPRVLRREWKRKCRKTY